MDQTQENAELRALIARLTQRVYRLEQRLGVAEGIASQPPPPEAAVAEAEGEPAFQPLAAASERAPYSAPPPAAVVPPPDSLERRIGSHWLNRVGVVALLVGVSYFLKLAFDSGWIGPGLRVLLGCAGGVALCLWSERFRRRDSLAFSYSLKAVGVGTLYLSLWASFQLYHLLPGAIAFLAMVPVTAATAGMAIVQDAELLAGLALVGGLLTPVLCSSHRNQQAVLFSYLLLLSASALALQRVKPWPRILYAAFAGSFLLAAGWFYEYYTNRLFNETLLFVSLLFVLYALVPLVAPRLARVGGRSAAAGEAAHWSGALLAVFSAALYFFFLVRQWQIAGGSDSSGLAGYAFGLAAFYFGLAAALGRRASERTAPPTTEADGRQPLRRLPAELLQSPRVHYGLAVTFVTIGVALQLHQQWITLAWLVEAALLFWAGMRPGQRGIQLFAAFVAGLGVFRLLVIDLSAWGEQPLVANPRLAVFAVAMAALLWMIFLDCRSPHRDEDRMVLAAGVVVVNLLALLAAGLEIHDHFAPLIRAAVPLAQHRAGPLSSAASRELVILRGFSYSALMMFYGAALMWLGFARRSALLRWQAILLIGATILKVFLFDVSDLDRGWRVLSFLVLGVLLLAVSYAYQRDWLRLQRPRSGPTPG
jgi:uncharacterized membrane protein